MSLTAVSVVIPTFLRPDGLRQAVESVYAQIGCEAFDVIIVDNDPKASARATADQLIASAPQSIRVRYIHAPDPGVANARNAAVAAVESPLIAFLDDDMSAAPGWLAQLLACHQRFPASCTFGPVEAILPESVTQHTTYFKGFFSRRASETTGFSRKSYGCGNCLIDLQRLPAERPLFDAAMNETGGEDDLLFQRVRETGGNFAWCAEAVTYEHVPAARATLQYTLKRAKSYGTGPITQARLAKPPNWPLVFGWMFVGAYKMVVNGALYMFAWATRSEARATYLDRAVRGLGKLHWWHDRRFYGQSRLDASK